MPWAILPTLRVWYVAPDPTMDMRLQDLFVLIVTVQDGLLKDRGLLDGLTGTADSVAGGVVGGATSAAGDLLGGVTGAVGDVTDGAGVVSSDFLRFSPKRSFQLSNMSSAQGDLLGGLTGGSSTNSAAGASATGSPSSGLLVSENVLKSKPQKYADLANEWI